MIKRLVLFIVEGRNDEREISAILHTPYFKEFLQNYSPQFYPLGHDITLDAPGKASIRNEICKVVRSWKNGELAPFNPIRNPQIKEVIHIVDMDGAGVPESAIVQDDVGSFVYEDEIIRAPKVGRVSQRNAIKKKNLMELAAIDQIDNLPYRVFYASCNMDHLLSNSRNPSKKYKDTFSFNYGNLLKANPELIFKTVMSDSFSTQLSYVESWQAIWDGTNSLNRMTNLNLLFREYGNFK